MNTDVLVAFDVLLEAMNDEKTRLADAVKEATLNARFAEAQHLLAKTERVERLMHQTRQLREAWERIDEAPATFADEAKSRNGEKDIAINDEAPMRHGSLLPAGEGAPELAIVDQVFGGRRLRRGRRSSVNKTPQRDYRLPILEALEQLGGRGRVGEVLNNVYQKMKDRLTEDDLKALPSGKEIRWANTAKWERHSMVKEGLLRDDSPAGVWEMTDAGRAYLHHARQQSKVGE